MEAYVSSYLREITVDVSSVVFLVGTLITIYMSHWIYRWRNPKCNGALPPGSMGLPFIGETIQLVIPSASLDLPPFIKTRIKRYGPIFRTNVAGRPVIITADPEFNHFLLRQDGKLVDTWSMDTFAEVFDQASQSSRKYTRSLTLNHFGVEALKGKLLPQMEVMVRKTLSTWSSQESVEVKSEAVTMSIDFAARQIFSGDLENAPLKISDMFRDLVEGLMSFPINLPGTAHHKCLQAEHEAILKNRADSDLTLTWNEYKSMTFTFQAGNIAPGFFRRALRDIPINGYTIPAGWVIMIATAGLHLSDNQFEDPLKFNPWRWK
ncbi:UNVERIFIED_CONTAM: cytochrome, partial [Sesamum latifolium]